MSIIRDKKTCQVDYVRAADRLMAILAEEGIARLPSVKPQAIETPCGPCNGLTVPDGHTICAVDIVRSGGILLEAVRKVLPDLKTAKILIQRDEETALPKLYYSKLPDGIEKLNVVLCDPMLATGGSALTAIEAQDLFHCFENILFINVVSCPEGLKALAQKAPGVRILTCALDSHLNEVKFIVPGLGDFGCLDALGKSTLEILLPKLRIYSYILLYCYKVAIAIQMAILMACLILFCRCWR
ncbi:unnamed protein product [Durusdinium trenchii]|uniref:Phosphoribosyltransferase domain-containing protein n=1 Tax=Durusdinium trenchii TaxID=1381693 RepID=A0ABP0IIV3_9DINO